jgi:glycosyltransferase involved in cell wall biosynthesis
MDYGLRASVPVPEWHSGFRLVRKHGRFYAIPPTVEPERLIHKPGALDRHPAVLSAATLADVQALIDGPQGQVLRQPPMPLGRVEGYDLFDHRGRVFAVPVAAGDVDLDAPEDRERAGVLIAASRGELEARLKRQAAARPVEFAGWLPVFAVSGNCGAHPQFAHTAAPPDGYRFTRSAPPADYRGASSRGPKLRARLSALGVKLFKSARTAFYAARVPLTFVLPRRGVTLRSRAIVFVAFVRLLLSLLWRGCKPGAVLAFLQTRHLQSQLLLGERELVFLTSMPYTFGQNPWVIEIEDPTTLFYPLVQNGRTCGVDLSKSPYLPIVRALLEADHCKAIVTHIRSTAELVPALFQSAIIAQKVVYAPLGVRLPQRWQRHEPRADDARIELLFINSWCQVPENFFVRGGLDILEAFAVLREKYPQLRLTMRTALPALDDRYLRIIEGGNIRLVNRFLSNEEMEQFHAESDIYLLPAARVHIVSLLQAMSYGLAVVGSDGWGMEEYLEDGRNGLVVRGRYGKASWADADAGVLREDYEVMYTPDPEVVAGIVDAVSRLVEDWSLRRQLGHTARADVRDKYNTETWNRGLQAALDKASGIERRVVEARVEASAPGERAEV